MSQCPVCDTYGHDFSRFPLHTAQIRDIRGQVGITLITPLCPNPVVCTVLKAKPCTNRQQGHMAQPLCKSQSSRNALSVLSFSRLGANDILFQETSPVALKLLCSASHGPKNLESRSKNQQALTAQHCA